MSRFFKVPWRLAAFVKRKMQLSIHTLLAAPNWLFFLVDRAQIHDADSTVQYDGGMSPRWLCPAAVCLVLFAPACKKPTAQKPVVVHVFRDLYSPYAHEVDHRILDFQSSNPRLPSGAPVVVESINEVDYKSALKGNFDKQVKVEAVILNSPADGGDNPTLVAQLAHSANICGAVKACPAVVPAFILPSSTGDQAAAAQVFIDFLSKAK